MGGCRCTYRNCTFRSDGKTHFFHYPVFDKVRCHQWLTNARKYEFLNLKLSQLKNRVICQHHFTNDSFMNSHKDKLKLQAVPTEDGPFCDSKPPKETQGLNPLAYEDIENDEYEYVSNRKANYNVKYADFLTNCEEATYLNNMCKVEDEDKKLLGFKMDTHPRTINSNNSKQVLQKLRIDSNNIVEPNKDTSNSTFTHEIIVEPCPPAHTIANETESLKPIVQPVQKRNNKIRIISEKKITEPEKQIPVPVSTASFEIVSPSMILNAKKPKPKSQSNIVPSESNTENVVNMSEMVSSIDTLSNYDIKVDIVDVEPATSSKAPVEKTIVNPPIKHVEPVVTPRKLSAERVAAINAKRNFNMKLKDIIEAGLNQSDIQVLPKKETSIIKRVSKKRQLPNETVASSLSKDSSLPNKSDYIISYLESRMNRMENLLMSKIDQNTQKIMELKKTFDPQKGNPQMSLKPVISNNLQDEAYKRHLYKEIKKYLTPDTNSMVYEELFINKFKPNAKPELEPPKKRRRRW